MLVRQHVTDALKFWELARIPFNLVLGAITAALIGRSLSSATLVWSDVHVPTLIILAVLANVAYCAIYPVDLFVQASGFRDQRGLWRPALWCVGTLFAGALTWVFASAIANQNIIGG